MRHSNELKRAALPALFIVACLAALGVAALWRGGAGKATAGLCVCPCDQAGARPAVSATTPAPVPRPPGKRLNFMVVVVDTLRQRDLGCYGAAGGISPNIDHFAKKSVLFERAYSQAPWTKPSVASLFTGGYPRRHSTWEERGRFAILAKKANTMAEIFQHHGFTTVALSANPNVAPHVGMGQGFDRFPLLSDYSNRTTARLTEATVKELKRLKAAANPFFLYVHYLDPHDPYDPMVRTSYCTNRLGGAIITNEDVRLGKAHVLSGEEALGKILRGGKRPTPLTMTPAEQDHIKGLYDCEVSLVDAAVGQLLQEVKALGLEQDTVVMLTSDHGEEFLEHGLMRHGYQLFDEMVNVPLIVRLPSGMGRPRRERRVVQHVDVLPTLLALSGLPAQTGSLDGDLLPLASLRPRRAEGLAFGSTRFRNRDMAFLVKGQHKLQVDFRAKASVLFDLEEDPKELAGSTSPSQLMEAMKAEMDRLIKAAEAHPLPPGERVPRRPEDPTPDKLREQLESLGYIQ